MPAENKLACWDTKDMGKLEMGINNSNIKNVQKTLFYFKKIFKVYQHKKHCVMLLFAFFVYKFGTTTIQMMCPKLQGLGPQSHGI